MEEKLRKSFSQAASELATFYKEIQDSNQKAYIQGRAEANQELISWCEDLQSQGLKYIPVTSFLEMMQRYPSNIKPMQFPESRKRIRDY